MINRFILLLLGFLVVGCQTNGTSIDPIKPGLENVSFDEVQKNLVVEPQLPSYVEDLVSQWFDQKVKIIIDS